MILNSGKIIFFCSHFDRNQEEGSRPEEQNCHRHPATGKSVKYVVQPGDDVLAAGVD